MDDVRFMEVDDEATIADRRRIHNEIIPTDPLSLDQRAVGNSTVRRPTDEEGLAFALARGFVEVERYLLPGDSVPYRALALA